MMMNFKMTYYQLTNLQHVYYNDRIINTDYVLLINVTYIIKGLFYYFKNCSLLNYGYDTLLTFRVNY
jgi:hypothetical protein